MVRAIFTKNFWVKLFVYLASVGMVVSCIAFYQGLQGYQEILPEESYVDCGVHEFKPKRVVRVNKGDSTYEYSRKSRTWESRNAYWQVYYKAIDGSGYAFNKKFGPYKVRAQEAKKAGNIKRRVLEAYDQDQKLHIFIAKEEDSIQSYYQGKVSYYSKILTIPLMYLPCYLLLLAWYFRVYKKRAQVS